MLYRLSAGIGPGAGRRDRGFYLISDDNLLVLNTDGVSEYMLLYRDLCGVEVKEAAMVLNADTTEEARNAVVRELVSRESPLGIYPVTMTGYAGHSLRASSSAAARGWIPAGCRRDDDRTRPPQAGNALFVPVLRCLRRSR